jgi:hypothetical protein
MLEAEAPRINRMPPVRNLKASLLRLRQVVFVDAETDPEPLSFIREPSIGAGNAWLCDEFTEDLSKDVLAFDIKQHNHRQRRHQQPLHKLGS